MNKMKEFLVTNKKVVSITSIVLLITLGIATCVLLQTKPITLKMEVFTVEVNEELDRNAETYLENVKNDEAKIDFLNVNIFVLGDYEGTIKVDDVDYKIVFKVVDTKAPTLISNKVKFSFNLEDTVDTVNETINEEFTIEDNYDKEFEALSVVTAIPETEKEIVCKVSAKDTSENVSELVEITIQFTEDGDEKDGLQKEETQAISKGGVTKKEEQSNTSEIPVETPSEEETEQPFDDNTTNGNEGTSAVKPAPKPQPTPEPTPPAPQPEPTPEPTPTPPVPETPVYTTPDGCIDGGLFNSQEEGSIWGRAIAGDENSQYYGWMIHGDSFANGQWHFYLQPMH